MSPEFFRCFPTSDGTCWELLRRELGEFERFGWALVAICGFGAMFLLVCLVTWLVVGIGIVGGGKIWGPGVAAISLIGFWGLVYLLRFGMLGWYLAKSKTACRVEIGSKFHFSNEPLGFFTSRRKCDTAKIKQLKIARNRSDKYTDEEIDFDFDLWNQRDRIANRQGQKFFVGPSDTEINNIPVMELQIRDTNGRKHRLLSQLANDDLYWLAQELRASLDSANQS